jgi:hypothetical protein
MYYLPPACENKSHLVNANRLLKLNDLTHLLHTLVSRTTSASDVLPSRWNLTTDHGEIQSGHTMILVSANPMRLIRRG